MLQKYFYVRLIAVQRTPAQSRKYLYELANYKLFTSSV